MAAKRSEGVGSTGLGLWQMKVGAPCAATPSVAFGDISPSRGEIRRLSPPDVNQICRSGENYSVAVSRDPAYDFTRD